MKILKALDAGFTAFCNELWLPIFGFHLFDDPADALEDECSCPTKECPLEVQDINDEAEAEDNEWLHVAGVACSHPFGYDHPCEKCGRPGGNVYVDVPVELAGSLGAPGDKSPEEVLSPEAASSGHPQPHDDDVRLLAQSIYENGYDAELHEHGEKFIDCDSYWPLIRTAQALIGQGWQQK